MSSRLDCEDGLPGREEERLDGDTTQDSGFYSSPGLGLHLDMELDNTLPRWIIVHYTGLTYLSKFSLFWVLCVNGILMHSTLLLVTFTTSSYR